MRGISLRAKLALGFGTLLTMLILTGALGFYSTREVVAAAKDVSFCEKRKEAASAVELGVRKQVQSASGYLLNGDQPSLNQYDQDKQEASQKLDELGQMVSTEKGKDLLGKIQLGRNQITATTDKEIAFRRESRAYEANDLASKPQPWRP